MRRHFSLVLAAGAALLAAPLVTAQNTTYPASAVIRGENIRVWAEPSSGGSELLILNRGDALTITGDLISAEGDQFYPVQLADNGQTGFVRAIFINPDSIVPVQVLEPAAETPADGGNRQNRRNQDQQEDAPPADQPPPDEANGAQQGGASASANDRQERRQRRQQEANAAEQDAVQQDDAQQDAAQDAPPPADAAATQPPAELPPAETPPAGDGAANDAAAPITFSGDGAVTTDPVALAAGDYTVVMTSEVSASVQVTARLLNADEEATRLFREEVESPQSWTSETEFTVDTAGDYSVKVSGLDDPWTITFTPVS
ncbi:MAG: hypothetical protein QM692_07460 [Thermomicrobiales bacterium]